MNAQNLRILLEKSDNKLSILTNFEILNQYNCNEQEIFSLIKEFLSDKEKVRLFGCPHFQGYESEIIECISDDEIKIEVLKIVLQKKCDTKDERLKILKALDVQTVVAFLSSNKENDIHPYEIVSLLYSNRQIQFVSMLENMNLTLSEKKEILVTLNDDVKRSIYKTGLPEEYKSIISLPTQYRKIKGLIRKEVVFDPRRNLEDYRGLDTLIRPIWADKFTEEERNTFMKLCDICPDLTVISFLTDSIGISSTGAEYKDAEEWISSIINSLDTNYSKAQKMAIIDNAIGKKIGYSPDYCTEVWNKYSCRALWEIISSGYGVCNGIARVEQYMLQRVGIESEIIQSANHAFLKVKDIELPLANGKTVKGNTILDPTWNLTANRFGGIPDSFCVSYEEARKNDTDREGTDRECHKNDEELKDATLSLDEQSLRQLFASAGLADKDGKFPINDLIKKSEILHSLYAKDPEQNVSKQFLLLAQTYPEFATCPMETTTILKDILLSSKNLEFDKCAINRVYDRTDKEKKPILFVYIDFGDSLGKRFYFVNGSKGEFVQLSQEEFVNQFECYDEDLKSSNRS